MNCRPAERRILHRTESVPVRRSSCTCSPCCGFGLLEPSKFTRVQRLGRTIYPNDKLLEPSKFTRVQRGKQFVKYRVCFWNLPNLQGYKGCSEIMVFSFSFWNLPNLQGYKGIITSFLELNIFWNLPNLQGYKGKDYAPASLC